MIDLLIQGGTVYTDGLEARVDLGIKDGRVVCWGANLDVEATAALAAENRVILPGFVELGMAAQERAGHEVTDLAAQGGATSLLCAMAFETSQPWSEALQRQREHDQGRRRVDCGYHYLVDEWTPERRRHLQEALAEGLQTVWVAREGGGPDAQGQALLLAVLRELPEHAVAIAQPSDPGFERYLRVEHRSQGPVQPGRHGDLFPAWLEGQCVARCEDFVHMTRGKLLLLGLTAPEALTALARGAERTGGRLLGGAALAHLALNLQEFEKGEQREGEPLPLPWPPLRNQKAQQRLWGGLDDGLLHVATALHRPQSLEQVLAAQKDIVAAPGGLGGLGHFAELLYSEGVGKFRLSLESLSQCAAADPAKLAGLYPRKGTLQVGADADLLIIDPEAEQELTAAAPQQHDFYAGMTLQGRLEYVFLRGACIAGEGAWEEPLGQPV